MKKKSGYQKYIVETIDRNEIKNAPYNPRVINPKAKQKLKDSLEKHGLVEPVVWNRVTGNLVGGHQRLQALDALEGTKDYSLEVSVIAVDEREEALLNVQLNNQALQGDWDIEKLADLSLDFDIGFEEMGFDELDVDFLFEGDDRFSQLFETPEVQQEKDRIRELKATREAGKEKMREDASINYYSIIVFSDEAEKRDFYKKISVPIAEEVLTIEQVRRYIG